MRDRVIDLLAWKEVAAFREATNLDEARKALLEQYTRDAQRKIPDAVMQAYDIVVAASETRPGRELPRVRIEPIERDVDMP